MLFRARIGQAVSLADCPGPRREWDFLLRRGICWLVRNVDTGVVARRGGSRICIVVDVDVEEAAD